MPDITAIAKQYISRDQCDSTRAEIQALLDDPSPDAERTLRDLFEQRLAFGTAGLRAKMQAGYSRMNDLTVIQSSQVCLSIRGLCACAVYSCSFVRCLIVQ